MALYTMTHLLTLYTCFIIWIYFAYLEGKDDCYEILQSVRQGKSRSPRRYITGQRIAVYILVVGYKGYDLFYSGPQYEAWELIFLAITILIVPLLSFPFFYLGEFYRGVNLAYPDTYPKRWHTTAPAKHVGYEISFSERLVLFIIAVTLVLIQTNLLITHP